MLHYYSISVTGLLSEVDTFDRSFLCATNPLFAIALSKALGRLSQQQELAVWPTLGVAVSSCQGVLQHGSAQALCGTMACFAVAGIACSPAGGVVAALVQVGVVSRHCLPTSSSITISCFALCSPHFAG